jgi:uncharacterized protein (TIGR02391 family)
MNLQTEIRRDLWDAIAKSYESQIYTSAILDAIHYMSSILRERANVDGDGVSLVGQALGGDNPRLRINKFQTETEKTEQKGFEQLLRGIYQGIRNPRSHEQHEDSEAVADATILFIDYILGIIGQAQKPFTLEEWNNRVFDPDFVTSTRYAELLASEVPTRKLNEALITIYRNKGSGDGKSLGFIFEAIIERAGDDTIGDFLAVVSEDLRIVQQDVAIKTALQILPPRLWPRLDEAARLRIENKLIRSIGEGKYDPAQHEKVPGWLATWAQYHTQFFSLKGELRRMLVGKLRGSAEDQNYVAQYFLESLAATTDPTGNEYQYRRHRDECIEAICTAVCQSDPPVVLRKKLIERWWEFPQDWRKLIIEGLKPLAESDPDYHKNLQEAEEIPF